MLVVDEALPGPGGSAAAYPMTQSAVNRTGEAAASHATTGLNRSVLNAC